MARIEKIDMLVDGGKAAMTPALAQRLGPMKVNLGELMSGVDEKTKQFSGMQVPVKVEINTETKAFDIKVGTPPVSSLIKKELKLEKGAKGEAAKRGKEIVGNLTFDQVVKIAASKGFEDRKAGVNQVLGTCKSMGVTVDGADPKDVSAKVRAGEYDSKL